VSLSNSLGRDEEKVGRNSARLVAVCEKFQFGFGGFLTDGFGVKHIALLL
jgi:hypothetical protein